MIVRPRLAGDLSTCVEVLREVHVSDKYPDRWPADPAGWLQPEGQVGAWVAEFNGDIVGHVALVGRSDSLWVSRLFVRPSGRGLRVGETLLAEARRQGQLNLDVIENSTAAIALYERTGWTLQTTRAADWVMADGTVPIERIYAANRLVN